MLQDSSWTPVVSCITKAILGNIQWLVTSRTTINRFQNTIYTPGIDFTKVVIQPGIIMNCARTHEAPSKKFSRNSRVEAHHFTSIVVYTMVIPGPRCACNRRKKHIQWKRELSAFRSIPGGTVKKGILQAGHTIIKW